jgi:serine/threonine-protein kinase
LLRLFAAACERPPSEREAFVRAESRGNEVLAAEVLDLLRRDEESDFLDEARLDGLRQELGGASDPTAAAEELPPAIGSYRVLAELGRGGMGIVYRAEQAEPRREVALKVLGFGFAGAAARRLQQEARVLARLQHPGIAQVYACDSQPTPHGRQPFLVLELVRGDTLLAWAQRTSPSLAERLRVLREIADAVLHAHQCFVIHRDLKPSNVLVDERGHPKVLDFGIARLFDDDATRAAATAPGQLLGTLAYMSPEQGSGDPDAIDVRTDVYGLGVLGYQLLGGRLPIDVSGDATTKALQRVLHEEPVPLGRLDRRLRGDLETIFACALQKDPARRYASMAAFADDLRRHGEKLPILARPATFAYRASRFVRRHALALLAIGGVFGGLGTALVASWHATERVTQALVREGQARRQAERNEEQARREEQLKGDVLEVLAAVFRSVDPRRDPAAARLSLAERMRAALVPLEGRFRASPADERRVRFELAQTLIGIGEHAAAEELLLRCVQLLDGAPPHHAAGVQLALARVRVRRNDADGALRALAALDAIVAGEATGATNAELVAPFAPRIAMVRGQALAALGRRDEATQQLLQARELCAGLAGGAENPLGSVLLALAQVQLQAKDHAGAAASIEAAAATLADRRDQESEDLLAVSATQALLLYEKGEFAAAAPLLASVRNALVRVYGDEHPQLCVVGNNLATALRRLGRLDEAAVAGEAAVALAERLGGKQSRELLPPLRTLAMVYRDQQRFELAEAAFARAIALHSAQQLPFDEAMAVSLHELSVLCRRRGDVPQSIQFLDRAVLAFAQLRGERDPGVLRRRSTLARWYADAGRRDEALAELQAFDATAVEVLGEHDPISMDAAWLRTVLLLDQKRFDEVPEWLATFRRRAAGTTAAAKCEAEAARLAARLQKERS